MFKQVADENSCRALLLPERDRLNESRRFVRHWVHSKLSFAPGNRLMLAWMLKRAMKRHALSEEACGVAVPLPYALKELGDKLSIRIPPAVLDLRLPDWVQCRQKLMHLGDYYVGLCDLTALAQPFSLTGVMREASELWQCDLDYRATRSYHLYRKRIAAGQPIRRNKVVLSSEALLDAYFERYLALIHSIRAHGVLSLRDARSAAAVLSEESAVRTQRTEAGERDIGVAIGPNGEIYALPGGKHRTAIAQMLGIDHVPVEVRMVHAEWLCKIGASRGTNLLDAIGIAIRDIELAFKQTDVRVDASGQSSIPRGVMAT